MGNKGRERGERYEDRTGRTDRLSELGRYREGARERGTDGREGGREEGGRGEGGRRGGR